LKISFRGDAMNSPRHSLSIALLIVILCGLLAAQQQPAAQSSAVVPRLVNFAGKAIDGKGSVATGVQGATFSIYKDQYDGAPLWVETQNITADAKGNYTVQLGAMKNEGMPQDFFTSGEARWLGIRINGGEEQPRVLLLSVPYALKAEDAQTLGGLPASAYMLAGASGSATAGSTMILSPATALPPGTVTGSGTADYVPLWTGSSVLTNSVLFQTGSGTAAKIGINTTTPQAALDINGSVTVRSLLNLPAAATATSAAGADSRPFGLVASTFNSSTHTAANQVFHWMAEPAGNNTSSPSATLNLLFGAAPNAAAETGLKINSKGQFIFAAGQTFPGAGSGTVTSVGLSAPSSDFTVANSPVTGSGTLTMSWNVPPTSVDTINAIVKRDNTGSFSAGAITAVSVTSGGTALTGNTATGAGVVGIASSDGYGVIGESNTGFGVYGQSHSFPGVNGVSTSNPGVAGLSGSSHGVTGETESTAGFGVYGVNDASGGTGIYGVGTVGVTGVSNGASAGVYGTSNGGWALDGYGTSGATGLLAGSDTGYAGWFNGDMHVDGTLSKAGGSFKIDDPLDPANKYLSHSFVESPDMMNIYNGNVTTDANGNAIVTLPNYFEALNRDFRYQLTVMGQFAQAIVSSEVENRQFSIKTDKPNVKVSWQVTGIRHDAWANAHRIPNEELKPAQERGFYQHPELYNAPAEKSIMYARFPEAMKQWKASRTQTAVHAGNTAKELPAPPKP
jgi:trimeric autotransporter adhesin